MDSNCKIINIGILGCGAIALNKHLPAVLANPSLKIRAFYNHSLTGAEAALGQLPYSDAYATDSLDRILNDDRIDAVCVCLPNSLHSSASIEAMKAGKHVLCEKPIACTYAEAQSGAFGDNITVYINEDGTTGDAIVLTKNGDYLEGVLPHLSTYALIVDNDETSNADEDIVEVYEPTQNDEATEESASAENKSTISNSPKTGDSVALWISLVVISTCAVAGLFIYTRKK